jgi:mRNA interferase MazF
MSPQPGEVWLADLGLAANPNPPRALVLYVPLTTQHRLSHTRSRFCGSRSSTATQWRTFKDWDRYRPVRLERKIGRLSKEVLAKLKGALAFALDLESTAS